MEEFPELDSNYVEYFFELYTDESIREEDLCPVIGDEDKKTGNIYERQFDCPDLDQLRRNQSAGEDAIEKLYKSGIKQEEIEECD